MNHRGLRITGSVLFFLSLIFLAFEIYFLTVSLHWLFHPVQYPAPLPPGTEDDAEGSAFLGIIFSILFVVWPLINVIIGGIVFYYRRKNNFPFVLSIIQIVLVVPKFMLILWLLYMKFRCSVNSISSAAQSHC